ncbi:glucokinase [Chachezhania sediminis]|uniref:glucokinase n=1 Tax=Chachezhania sediminis TaxID=2599291 RepID=UPI00131DD613|nr:ROK family protein [Chachezhania sediminis]
MTTTTDPFLLCDMGGTNCRLALSVGGGAPQGIRSFRNDDFDSGYAVIDAYLDGIGRPALGGVTLAMAGPVIADGIRLTNRDWKITHSGMAKVLSADFDGPVVFINDLMALGYATCAVTEAQCRPLHPGSGIASNGQSFVLACGTGINGSMAVRLGPHITAAECDLGHITVPGPMLAKLAVETQGRFDPASCIEEVLSGRGVAQLCSLIAGEQTALTPPQIVARAVAPGTETDDPAARTVALQAELAAWFIHSLTFAYRPADGFYLGGSVFRALLDSAAGPGLIATYDALSSRPFTDHPALHLITDDLAPLSGLSLLSTQVR